MYKVPDSAPLPTHITLLLSGGLQVPSLLTSTPQHSLAVLLWRSLAVIQHELLREACIFNVRKKVRELVSSICSVVLRNLGELEFLIRKCKCA